MLVYPPVYICGSCQKVCYFNEIVLTDNAIIT